MAKERFVTLRPSAELPSGDDCAKRVLRSPWEPRPKNYRANHTTVDARVNISGATDAFNVKERTRIDGNFTGTTDEIIQWAACKWGFDEDISRARAVEESYWRQSMMGDKSDDESACSSIEKSVPCWESYGIFQVKGTVHKGTYPAAEQSTAFNADYALAWLRACYEGAFSDWLRSPYTAGDEWGCIGAWYSGNWYDKGAKDYIARIRAHLEKREWERAGF